MKKFRRAAALVLTAFMAVGILGACGKNNESETPEGTEPTITSESGGTENTDPTEEANLTPLVVGYADFSGKFSPFFGETAYDMDVSDITQISLLTTDRTGAIIFNAIEGETHSYNGVDYLYTGAANLEIDRDLDADTTTYTWTLREGMQFSDGQPVTADDVIFSYYVYADPSYEGPTTFGSLAIIGMKDYQTQTSAAVYTKYSDMFDAIRAAGEDHVWSADDAWTQEYQDEVFTNIKEAWYADLQVIIDYMLGTYMDEAEGLIGFTPEEIDAEEGLQIAFGLAGWNFASCDAETKILTGNATGNTWDLGAGTYPTMDDMYNEAYAMYEGDASEYSTVESVAGNFVSVLKDEFVKTHGPNDPELAGKGIPNIEGIKKIDDYTVTVTVNGYDAAAVYRMASSIAPLHYYGEASKYDYENNKFGFDFGDLSNVQAKTSHPMGAGPYMFVKYENKVVSFEANPYYYKGEPKTKYLQFKETAEADMVSGIGTGAIDVSNPSFSKDAAAEISSYNANGETTGDTIVTSTVDNLGYGYIGINADAVNVGGEPASEASKNLRTGIATILSVYRELTVDSYYGETASVINYPISNTSWAAPQMTDHDYTVAFSTKLDGTPIYSSSMSADDKFAAAIEACIEYLKAAGYTFDDASGKFTAAPAGAKLEYEVIIPANGSGSHPSFILLSNAKEAFDSIGINLIINDPADANILWNALDAGTQEMWCAAWGATIDPDMKQVYYSTNVVGTPGASGSNHYHIRDAELDTLIDEARTSEDQTFRKATYKACLDIIIDWAVEIPVYQRQNCIIFSEQRVDMSTMTPDITTYYGWMANIEGIRMK